MMIYSGLWLMLFLEAMFPSSLPRPPFTSKDDQMQNDKAMQNPVSTVNCVPIRRPLQDMFLSRNQQSSPTRNSSMEILSRTSGAQATASSLRVAVSAPSNRKSDIMHMMADVIEVITELQSRPSEADARLELVG
jgi:hypothetical protein